MTYTREQVEACVRGAVMEWVGAITEGQAPPAESFLAVQDAAAIGLEVLRRLDRIETQPQATETKYEQPTGRYRPSLPESEWKFRSFSPPDGGDCVECGEPWICHWGPRCPR